MRDVLSTAGVMMSIFVIVALMFIGPKGFSLTPEKAVVVGAMDFAE